MSSKMLGRVVDDKFVSFGISRACVLGEIRVLMLLKGIVIYPGSF